MFSLKQQIINTYFKEVNNKSENKNKNEKGGTYRMLNNTTSCSMVSSSFVVRDS